MGQKIKWGIYWLFYISYSYIIMPSALSKIFEKESMMESMLSLGFDRTWTIAIGIVETIGVLMVVTGLWKSQFRTLGVIWLFPFAIGAFTTHMAHQEYEHFYNSLIMCVLPVFYCCWIQGSK